MSARTSDYTEVLNLKRKIELAIKCKETRGQLKLVRNSYGTAQLQGKTCGLSTRMLLTSQLVSIYALATHKFNCQVYGYYK